jgi:hypothetical protein
VGQGRQGIGRENRLSQDKATVDPALIDEVFVLQASRLAGIELTPEQLPGVVEHLRRTAEVAALVNSVVLSPQDEQGPTWRP